MRTVVALLLIAVLCGCQSAPPVSRAEYLAATTRVYPDISQEELYAAAEAMFSFSDPSYRFGYSDAGMQAVDSGFGGGLAWTLAVSKAGGGVRLQVSMSGPGMPGLAPVMVSGGGVGFGATAGSTVPVLNPASFTVFWARLDYMLGKRSDWLTCKQVRDLLIDRKIPDMGGLCGSRLMDPVPTGPAIKPRQAVQPPLNPLP